MACHKQSAHCWPEDVGMALGFAQALEQLLGSAEISAPQ